MTAKVLDGRAVAAGIRCRIRDTVADAVAQGHRPPGLAVVLVGDDSASRVYVRNKHRACESAGMVSRSIELPATVTTAELQAEVESLNQDPEIDGILVQLPLPGHVETRRVLDQIRADKDVDGFHAINMGNLVLRHPGIRPCTPRGIMVMLRHYGLSAKGREAVVVGASNIVGRPMALELLLDGATVTVCHRFTRPAELEAHVRRAEVLVVAVGRRDIVDSDWIRDGAIVVDVGMNRSADGALCGDLDADNAARNAAWLTPVPGGVGPMTVATLLQNTLEAAGLSLEVE